MFYNDESPLGAFLGIITLSAMSYFSYKKGESDTLEKLKEHQRDIEIKNLRAEIEYLKNNNIIR